MPDDCSRTKDYTILIIGASYAGITAALTILALRDGQKPPLETYVSIPNLKKESQGLNLKIVLLDKRDGFFHTVSTPLVHVTPEHASHMWRRYTGFPKLRRPDVQIIQGSVLAINPDCHCVAYMDGQGQSATISYDYAIISTGLRREWPVAPGSDHRSIYLDHALNSACSVRAATKHGVVVIGGVGVEFAGKIKMAYPHNSVTLVHSRDQLLSKEPLPERFKSRVLEMLREQGVKVILGERPGVIMLPDNTYRIELNHEAHIFADRVLWAISQGVHSTGFLPDSILNEDGTIKIDAQQRVLGEPLLFNHVFAAGDVTERQEIKLAGTAMLMGLVAAANIYSLILADAGRWRRAVMTSCPPVYLEPKMSLSIGSNMLSYCGGDEASIREGEDVARVVFGADLGWQRILNSLGLQDHDDDRTVY
ncbi:hypothetical protein ASPBRDRAFT_31256 [Aspergillus brasiliensis CBS 101740]|uniref:FAD/NAD(P)-binding domain-containing protein n=1 Tax=Aspergillus brasiliensis (strain CBS 101740 / IMI 381727 / IBT 21946) TaxID=767769 RepID=A0A1L9UFC7_ASPBC|nr:hypothetical protein ASPBRDRAFT_31256 [Aspergillus brasiliensis CBS 101740]